MFRKLSITFFLSFLIYPHVRVVGSSPSEAERLQKLERAVEQLQKRNAKLEAEVCSLKNQTAFAPEGKMKTKVTCDGKTYVEKTVVEEEKLPVYGQLHSYLVDFREANPEFGEDQFDEVIGRIQVMF